LADKVKFNINVDKFSEFTEKLSDLTSIDDTVKLKIDNEHILMYSMLGGNVMLAFKNYLLNTKDFLESKEDLEFTYDVIIANCNKFVKTLEFIKNEPKITLELSYKESPDDKLIMNARTINIVGGKMKVNWLAAERYEVRDINKNILDQRLDIKNRKWSFVMTKGEFSDIKKLSSINSDKIVNINVNDGKVIISETSAWELEIGEIDKMNANFIFNKRFFKCINSDREEIEFSLFDSFILVKDQNTNLMLSYEQDFEIDD